MVLSRKPEDIPTKTRIVGAGGKNSIFRLFLVQHGGVSMSWENLSVIRQDKELCTDRFDDPPQVRGCRGVARSSRKERISSNEKFIGKEAETAGGMARGMDDLQLYLAKRDDVTVSEKDFRRMGEGS